MNAFQKNVGIERKYGEIVDWKKDWQSRSIKYGRIWVNKTVDKGSLPRLLILHFCNLHFWVFNLGSKSL